MIEAAARAGQAAASGVDVHYVVTIKVERVTVTSEKPASGDSRYGNATPAVPAKRTVEETVSLIQRSASLDKAKGVIVGMLGLIEE